MFVVGVKATQNVDQYSRHHVTYAQAKFEVFASKFRRRCIYKKTYENCCPVPSTSCDMCTCKVWRLRWRCIYKKIPNLTFDLDLEVNVTNKKRRPVASTSCDLLKLYGPTVSEKIQLHETWRTDKRTDGRWADVGTKLICPFFLTKKRV